MKKTVFAFLAVLVYFSQSVPAQIQTSILVQIVRAEDELRFDKSLENLLKNADARIRTRAALAAGRIGNEAAIPALAGLLKNDKDPGVRTMAAFALGEIESTKAADAILKILNDTKNPDPVRARALEAAGKIAAANSKEEKSKDLGEAVLDNLEFEVNRGKMQNREVILLGLTAVLRARPEGGDLVTAKFLTNLDARIRADAANTLTRLRAKNANAALEAMLLSENDAVARANAARALGAAEDQDALNLLLEAALNDDDLRVRVSAIRALGSLKNASVAEKLVTRGASLLANYKKSKFANPPEKNEMLEIATTLGRILPNSNKPAAVAFLDKFRDLDLSRSPEIEIAFARLAPDKYVEIYKSSPKSEDLKLLKQNWQIASSAAQGLGELATNPDEKIREKAEKALRSLIEKTEVPASSKPDILTAFAAFKTKDLNEVLQKYLISNDVFIRASAANLLAETEPVKENIEALKTSFTKALLTDKIYDDAQLAILDALFKLDKKEAVGTLLVALNAPDYLVRKKAFELLRDKDLEKDFPGLPTNLENALAKKKDQVLPYSPAFGTKLGQILNSNADYVRAVSRKNGSVKAILTTEKGNFTIDLMPEDAPLTVDNFIKLARRGYFNGLAVHRVVPNFVMQDGDPRGDGNGGPGWSIRCEINLLPYERGVVGMALSGKDTGGSQWFVTHSPQPHLDGGYTVFGRVNETDMKVVDSIVRGDRILSVKIVERK